MQVNKDKQERLLHSLLLIVFMASIFLPRPAYAEIVYSGIKNLVLQGFPNSPDPFNGLPAGSPAPSVSLRISLTGTGHDWDILSLSISAAVLGSSGTNDVVPGSWAVLASTPGTFPWVHRLNYGDPYPLDAQFGGGSLLLWDYQPALGPAGVIDRSEFRNATGYAALEFGENVPQYRGWIHLRVDDYTSSTPTLTVIDWAYSNVIGEMPYMGQGGPPPDNIPPTTTAAISPSSNANGWNNTNVAVTMSATDNVGGSGVKQIEFALGGAQNTGWEVAPGQVASATISAEGATVLSYSAIDNAGNQEATKALTVKIDKTPPVISGMPTTGCVLWPANRKLVQVAMVTATDALSGLTPGSFKLAGASNEPSDPTNPDIVITPNGSGGYLVQLRADRLGVGPGRAYTLNATATDLAGNVATVTATCSVPHDRGSN